MKQFQYTIKDELGVHARPAGLLVKLAKQYTSTITLEKNGKTCDMRKLMAVMGMGIRQGASSTAIRTYPFQETAWQYTSTAMTRKRASLRHK